MDPTSGYQKAPEFFSHPSPAKYKQTTCLEDRTCVYTNDTRIIKREPPIISKLSGACLRSLQQILHDTKSELVPKRQLNVLRRAIDSFILWDDGYGARSGLLDEKLERSNHLYSTILSLLCSLCKTAQYGKYSWSVDSKSD